MNISSADPPNWSSCRVYIGPLVPVSHSRYPGWARIQVDGVTSVLLTIRNGVSYLPIQVDGVSIDLA